MCVQSTATPPVEAPSTVLTMARATTAPSPGCEMDAWLPPLKARKPKRRMKPPRPARATECPGRSLTEPSSENLNK